MFETIQLFTCFLLWLSLIGVFFRLVAEMQNRVEMELQVYGSQPRELATSSYELTYCSNSYVSL